MNNLLFDVTHPLEIFINKPQLFISAQAYTIPAVYANDYRSGELNRGLCDVEVRDANGTKTYKSGATFSPTVNQSGDKVSLTFKFAGVSLKTIEIPTVLAWEEIDGTCTAEQDFEDVKRVCNKIGIPYFSVNFAKEYYELHDVAPTFSEWCTTWGTPAEERLLKIAPIAADLGIKYLQVDAGWFHADKTGDWVIKDDLYPRGFRAFSESLQKLGMESGIWFEFETIYPGKKPLEETGKENMVLKIDGFPLKTGGAYFLDFRKPEVIKHLTEKVADFLRDNKVGYLKIDYNSCIPFGIDGESKSYAQNLQDHMVEVRKFHENLHKLVPGLRIEECASGGHRLTPGWAKFGEYVSCSDAHEGIEIPLIAAEVMRFCYYDKALVWATLRSDDDSNRLSYSLCAGFLGQMTLSGDLDLLSSEQIETVRRYLDFYAKLSPELRLGGKLRIDCSSPSRMYPTGRQIVTLETEKEFLQIIHFFETDVTAEEFALPAGDWELVDSVKADSMKLAVENGKTKVGSIPSFSAAALLFRKK